MEARLHGSAQGLVRSVCGAVERVAGMSQSIWSLGSKNAAKYLTKRSLGAKGCEVYAGAKSETSPIGGRGADRGRGIHSGSWSCLAFKEIFNLLNPLPLTCVLCRGIPNDQTETQRPDMDKTAQAQTGQRGCLRTGVVQRKLSAFPLAPFSFRRVASTTGARMRLFYGRNVIVRSSAAIFLRRLVLTFRPWGSSDILGRSEALRNSMDCFSHMSKARAILQRLACADSAACACMNGRAWHGDSEGPSCALADELAS